MMNTIFNLLQTRNFVQNNMITVYNLASYSHSASLHPGVSKGTGELNGGGNPAMDKHPTQSGVEIVLVASGTETGIMHWPDEPIGLCTDFTLSHVT